MANLIQIAQSGVNPVTGSYLSAENRKKLFRLGKNKVSSSVFGSGGAIVPVRSSIQPESLRAISQQNTSSISTLQAQIQFLNQKNIELTNKLGAVGLLQNQINILRVTVTDLTKKLQEIGVLITTDTNLEKQRDAQELETERRSAQTNIRKEKEGLLEKKIQSALVAPVKAISQRVQGTLQSLMSFFGTLFVGWLTNQGIEALRASFNDNKRKLEDIKNSVIRNLAMVGGIFVIFKFGIGAVLSSITRLSLRVGQFVLANTIGRLFQGLKNLIPFGGGAKTPPGGGGGAVPTPGGKPGGGKPGGGKPGGGIGGFIGKGLTVAGGIMDLVSGENIDATLAAGAAFAPGALKIPFSLAYGADAIAEIFGGNLFGKNPNESQTSQPQPQPQTQSQPSSNTQTTSQPILKPQSSPVSPVAQPQTPVIPPSQTSQQQTPVIPTSPSSQQQTPTTAPAQPSSELVKKFEMAWQYRNNPMARGRIESEWGKMSPEQKQMAVDWAKSKGYDWNEMRLQSPPAMGATSTTMRQQVNATQTPLQISPLPSQIQKIDTVPFNIGPEPEPKPNIVYRRTGSESPQNAPSAPLKTGPASEVPNISSSNSSNMYILYSQVNYNVVM